MNKGLIIVPLRSVYWPVQKVAHTSILQFMGRILNISYEGWIHHNHDIFKWTDDVIHGHFNFAYVRNPFDRIKSLYNDKIAVTLDTNVFLSPFYAGMPFLEFVNRIVEIPVKNEHYELQSKLIPEGVSVFKIEQPDVFLSMAGVHNKSFGPDPYCDESRKIIAQAYEEDFKKFNYENSTNNR